MSALKQAGTVVCEPMHRFRLELPADTLAATWPVLARLHAVARDTGDPRARRARWRARSQRRGCTSCSKQVPGLTRGEGVLESAFDHYEPVRGAVPTRAADRPQPAQPQGVPPADPPAVERAVTGQRPRQSGASTRSTAPSNHGSSASGWARPKKSRFHRATSAAYAASSRSSSSLSIRPRSQRAAGRVI